MHSDLNHLHSALCLVPFLPFLMVKLFLFAVLLHAFISSFLFVLLSSSCVCSFTPFLFSDPDFAFHLLVSFLPAVVLFVPQHEYRFQLASVVGTL